MNNLSNFTKKTILFSVILIFLIFLSFFYFYPLWIEFNQTINWTLFNYLWTKVDYWIAIKYFFSCLNYANYKMLYLWHKSSTFLSTIVAVFWTAKEFFQQVEGPIYLVIFDTPLLMVICLLLSVALMTLIERLFIGSIQRRSGPAKVGPSGILQPFADALKLGIKEPFKPKNANSVMFIFAPIVTLILSLLLWSFVSFDDAVIVSNPTIAFLFILGISGLNVFTIFTAGWSSNSKFAFLGALRSVAQMVAYELCLGTIVVTICFATGSYNLNEFMLKQEDQIFLWTYFGLCYLFFISALAETNRHPFDLPEAEAELVSGYNVEYGGMRFALFFLAEYANILFMSGLTVILFLGGWQPIADFFLFDWLPASFWFSIKLVFIVFCFVLVRAAFPRYRYDQLMTLVWKRLLPLSFGFFVFHVTINLALGNIIDFI